MVQEVAFTQLVDELVQNLKTYLEDCRDQPMVRRRRMHGLGIQ